MTTDQLTPNEVIGPEPGDDEREHSLTPWPVDDDATVSHVRARRKRAEDSLGQWYDAAKTDFEFAEGKQWDEGDREKLENENRVAAVFNRVAPIINSILGQEVTNRQEVRFLPRRIGEVSGADTMNDAVRWVRDSCNAEDEDSDAFSDMVTCGMGWTVTRMDYEKNPQGMPDVQRRDPLLMRWDPAARRKNLADARWVQADYWMTEEQIEDRWPDADLDGVVSLSAPQDQKSPHNATDAWKYRPGAAGVDQHVDEFRVVHHVERFQRTVHRMVDEATGQMREFSSAEYANLVANCQAIGMPVPQCAKIKTAVYWHAWTVGAVALEAGEAPAQKDFPYQCMTCYRERDSGHWYGVVRMMLDPQRYANRLMSLMMSILATGPKGGLLYETGTFANPKLAKTDWARHDSTIELTPGAIANQKFMAKPAQQMPQGAAELMQFAITSIRDVTGVNVDMLGGAGRDQPGVVEDMRTKAGLTILAKVFDALRQYRKRQGILLAEFVERFISDGRLIRIVGPSGQQYIPLLRNEPLEYDVVVDESPAARDVKERTWAALQIVAPMAMQAGVPIPPSILDYAPIPQSLALEWKQMIAKKEAQGPQPSPLEKAEQIKAQAAQQKVQMELQADAAKAQAKMAADNALAQAQMQADAMLANIRQQHEAQIEALKAQKSQMTEQAQMQADVEVEKFKAEMEARLAQMRTQFQLELEAEKASRSQETELAVARIKAMTTIEAARISAGIDAGDAIESALEQVSMPGADLASAIKMLHETVSAPRRLVRDAQGRPTASVIDPAFRPNG